MRLHVLTIKNLPKQNEVPLWQNKQRKKKIRNLLPRASKQWCCTQWNNKERMKRFSLSGKFFNCFRARWFAVRFRLITAAVPFVFSWRRGGVSWEVFKSDPLWLFNFFKPILAIETNNFKFFRTKKTFFFFHRCSEGTFFLSYRVRCGFFMLINMMIELNRCFFLFACNSVILLWWRAQSRLPRGTIVRHFRADAIQTFSIKSIKIKLVRR